MQSEPFMPPGEILVVSLEPESGFAEPNAQWRRILGSASTPFGRMAPGDQEQCEGLVESAAGGTMTTAQLFLLPADPDPRPVLLNFIPVHLPGRGRHPVMVTGELLEQPGSWTESQTEQHRMETLGRMTMGIAHDFNNLLSGIIGHTELMRGALRHPTDDEVLEEHVHTIEQASQDGASLIKKIQRYIRQEQRTAFIPVDLPGLIQDCVVLTRPYWYNEPRRKGIAISVEQDLREVPTIMGSASELRDVLVNLMLNAVQAMPEGGLITLRTWVHETLVCLSIRDSGMGIEEHHIGRIFEPLFTTKAESGTGMGLAVVSGVVQEHDGRIEVESSLGEGTAFVLRFPTGSEASTERTPDDTHNVEPEESPSLRVLIVDDEPMVRSVLGRLLKLRQHTVVEAGSGQEGLDILEKRRFDAIITDQGMPEMNGRQFAKAVRSSNPDLPIMLLTGDTHMGSTDDTIDAVLAKPFRIEEVNQTLLKLADPAL